MSLSVLDIEKGANELEYPFNKKIEMLTELEQNLLEDKKVQLYVFLHNEIKNTEQKEAIKLNDYYSDVRKQCAHPLYLCVTCGNDNGYVYKCVCINCGATKHFEQYELDELFANHRVIAQKVIFTDKNGNDTHYYEYLPNFNETFDYYKECCKRIQDINDKLHNTNTFSLEDIAAEMTFHHFIYPDKEKKSDKQYVKNMY